LSGKFSLGKKKWGSREKAGNKTLSGKKTLWPSGTSTITESLLGGGLARKKWSINRLKSPTIPKEGAVLRRHSSIEKKDFWIKARIPGGLDQKRAKKADILKKKRGLTTVAHVGRNSRERGIS